MKNYNLKISTAFLWVAIYFGFMFFYTFLDVTIWRKISPDFSSWLNIITIALCVCGFIILLKKTGYELQILSNTTITGILLAIGCFVLFFLLLDNCLDPIFESIFPASEQAYQESIQTLIKSPITSLLQVCIIAPVIEEILMRGFILDGLKDTYGVRVALIVSAILFALLHFNMVQTLSAFVCGLILGLLYLKTKSILCCIIAHCGYNVISYITMIYPYIDK
ncbi:CPBP family intramembrane glutamic endopeptidase [Clostridium sp. UBA6640]|uniref:CPBP family intramembrane glutamic endopeptidase n=1 Tax=Clostridium sp. UBA6640 TaxID=1946370 RepID=UPI0025C19BB7|nr:type II CAAX endopeptidase family protein [Clostridium sp. UBA6640]